MNMDLCRFGQQAVLMSRFCKKQARLTGDSTINMLMKVIEKEPIDGGTVV
jgi:hypothetical protein